MPLRPKFIHPLRVVRAALNNKSQPEFAKMFGVSASCIQKVELGQRTLDNELADAIMLRLGVDAESLKRKRAPVHLIGSGKADFTLWSGRRSLYHTAEHPEHWFTTAEETSRSQAEMDKAVKEYAALKKVTDQRERFRRCVMFWQKRIVPAWRSDQWLVGDALHNKLEMLFQAAGRENKYHSVAMRLSRWIDNTVSEFRLRTTINVIRDSRSGRDAQWPAFMDTLSESFRLKPHSRRRKR